MAALGSLEALLNGLPDEIHARFLAYTRAWVPFLRFGAPDTAPVKAENFGAALVPYTTNTVANAETAVAHGLGRVPRMMFQLLALNVVNATAPVITVTKAADASYLYIKSATTGASGHLFVEMLVMAVGLSSVCF